MSEVVAGIAVGFVLMFFVLLILAGSIIAVGIVFGVPAKVTFGILQKVVDKRNRIR